MSDRLGRLAFDLTFAQLTGKPPFPWQCALYEKFSAGEFPPCNLPTGLGKTSVIAIWLIALANAQALVPRRLVYVVNRRTVVDQTTDEVEKVRKNLKEKTELKPLRDVLSGLCALPLPGKSEPLAISTLRGQFADNREWSADPFRPAVICGTVDMIGSRLLFSGYGVGFRSRPLHAGFLGQDALLIHDEAHLEPAFQKLLTAIVKEQQEGRFRDFRPLRVIDLSATSRDQEDVFRLTIEESNPQIERSGSLTPLQIVWKRITARKGIAFHSSVERANLAKQIGATALRHKESGKAILVFVQTVEGVNTVSQILTDRQAGVPSEQVQRLTGTQRGLERDRLLTDNAIFSRFLLRSSPNGETNYLVCTSAGEVGIDLSADHMVCDLTTYDSMAQRLGRVNRRGDGEAEVDVVYEIDPDPKKGDDDLERARWRTLESLKTLPACEWNESRQDASPYQLSQLMGRLSDEDRKAVFTPLPKFLPTSDILFDAWSFTTIKDQLPGRPPINEYLHGVSEWEPPQTSVAWREDVSVFTEEVLRLNKLTLQECLDAYPLKPHELLKDRSDRIFKELQKIVARGDVPIWTMEPGEAVLATTLANLVERGKGSIEGLTLVLPPAAGGLEDGFLNGAEPPAEVSPDVADEWFSDEKRRVRRRIRVRNELDERIGDMRPILGIKLLLDPENVDDDPIELRSWYWFERPISGDSDGSKAAQWPVRWQVHTDNVRDNAARIVEKLHRKELAHAVILAAQYHDLGKKREVWQRSIGHRLPQNPTPDDWFAKSGKGMTSIKLTSYRHEFGSLADVHDKPHWTEIQSLSGEMQDLALHLIAAHHGYGRPHFVEDQTFDWEHPLNDTDVIAREVPRRFARLQRQYGRWGLAYLESLLRAADYAASARPTEFVENHQEISS